MEVKGSLKCKFIHTTRKKYLIQPKIVLNEPKYVLNKKFGK